MPPLRRVPVALALVMSALMLLSCSSQAVLDVDPGAVVLDSTAPTREVVIRNSGAAGSLLSWEIAGETGPLRLSPSRGTVRAGDEGQRVELAVDFSGLRAGSLTSADLQLRSNGGSASLPVRIVTSSGGACTVSDSIRLEGTGFYGESDSLQPDSPAVAPGYAPGEILIGYASLESPSPLSSAGAHLLQAQEVRSDHGVRLLGTRSRGRLERVVADDPVEASERLREDPRVRFAHPNYYLSTLSLPNDPCYSDQWNLRSFGLERAWGAAGDAPVTVAVIDTGIDVDHEDLSGKTLPGWDFWEDDDDVRLTPGGGSTGHGTHVAGIAVAKGDNAIGITGVAYGDSIRLLPVKVFGDDGQPGTVADLVDAILWSAGLDVGGVPRNANPADVVNISLGAGTKRIEALDWAAERARSAGALLVAAAGNGVSVDGSKGVQSPANSPLVLAVGSIDEGLSRSSFSDWGANGPTVDLMAPGGYGPSACGRVRSTLPGDGYGCMAGTSMASPFVAGVAALLLTAEPDLTPSQLEERLRQSTYFDPAVMSAAQYGDGIVCAARALAGTSDRTSDWITDHSGPDRGLPCDLD